MRTLAMILQGSGSFKGAPARNRRRAQWALALCFAAGFALVAGRAISYAVLSNGMPSLAMAGAPPQLAKARPDIVDRNGRILATDIRVYWLAATGKEIPHPDDAAEKLAGVFPELRQAELARKFRRKPGRFEWLKRGMTPGEANAVQTLGIPGLTIFATVGRVLPEGNETAQIVGMTNIDNEGITGVERYIDRQLAKQVAPVSPGKRPIVKLALDSSVQHALMEELADAMVRYRAIAALGIVMNVRNGEVLASASLPDFDPIRREEALDENRRDRVVHEIYELGSVFKTFTVAMALDQGVAGRYDRFDTTPLRMGRFLLHDAHASRASATIEDIYVHSLNTGAARIAEAAGMERQQNFLRSLGLFETLETEAGTSMKPVFPAEWRPANVATVAYGHGIAVPPIVFASAMAAIVNGGQRVKPTFLLAGSAEAPAERVLQPETSAQVRELMRLVVQRGTGHRAAVAGLDVGGKTGTALKVKNGHYTRDVVNSFVAVLPVSDPKYLILVTLDEPKPEAPGKPNEAAYNAAPAAGALIKRIAPMLGILPEPRFDETAARSYEQADSTSPQPAVFRKSANETSGSDSGYSADSGHRFAAGAGNYGDNRR
jgi:cell division protein FtsI (penicillin-binding protein 3)